MTKLEELQKEIKKADEAYVNAKKAFYFQPDFKDCDDYFSIEKKRKELEKYKVLIRKLNVNRKKDPKLYGISLWRIT